MPYFWPLIPSPSSPPVVTPAEPFVALSGAPRKAEEIKKLVPPWMETRYPSITGAILHALGIEDHRITVGDRTLFIRGKNPAGNVLYVAKLDDATIQVKQYVPAVVPSSLVVTVTGHQIDVSLAADSSGNVTTTAQQLREALAASSAASLLVGLTTFGSEDQPVGVTRVFVGLDLDGLEGARRDLLLNYARGGDLAILGNNYGISKPLLLGLSDDQFRQYIAKLAFKKKCNRASIEALLTVIFGPKSTAGWSVYESLRRRTITIEVTPQLLSTGPASGTFLRTSATLSTSSHTGDYLRSSALSPFFGRVKPTSSSALSPIVNNSAYLKGRNAVRSVLLDVLKLVRAAGVRVEFLQKGA